MTDDPRRRLNDAWAAPATILGWLGTVNHKQVGLRYIATALGFFVLAGIDITLIRAQLAVPDAGILPPDRFNQLFTTHGTAMMFLFAVPIVEGIAIYLLPLMLGAREMAFPRLNAFGYWLYLFGGLLLYASTLPDIVNFVWPGDTVLPVVVPDAGWFAYPPLSSGEYSPGLGLDFWLMGVTLAEISALIAAIEIAATILTVRAAGMTAMRLPLFAWSVLVMAFAILFAFPAVVLASALLELERAFGMPFYDPDLGGSPILWQHLFWIFGHPEVYIMFLPATGIVSMVLPAFTGRAVIGYRFIVAALIATGVLSFGLWVHHMFAVGLPWLGLAYFSAASMLITIPSGVQVFAWLATMVRAPSIRLTTAMLFVIGFLVTFVLGGVTGVMVASVPFDLQAHDTYFVVAHFHYVLVGGVVFPVFAALFYWFPKATGRVLSERLGKWFFWLFFIGFNVTFLPQHQLGLLGMRRRVYTYESEPWMDILNLVSSLGQGLMIAGVALLGVAVVLAWRSASRATGDPWQGRTLEWATSSPPPQHNFTSLPIVRDREPMADDPDLPRRLDEVPPGLAGAARGDAQLPRETMTVDPLDAMPDAPTRVPRNSLLPLASAAGVAGIFAAFLLRLYPVAVASALAAFAVLLAWAWVAARESEEPAPAVTLDAGSVAGRHAGIHMTWGGLLAIGLAATVYLDAAFAHLYLAYRSDRWPPAGATAPDGLITGVGVVLLVAGAVAAGVAWHRARGGSAPAPALTGASLVALLAGAVAMLWPTLTAAPDPSASAYAASLWALVGASVAIVLAGATVAAFALARTVGRGGRPVGRPLLPGFLALWLGFAATSALVSWAAVQAGPGLLP